MQTTSRTWPGSPVTGQQQVRRWATTNRVSRAIRSNANPWQVRMGKNQVSFKSTGTEPPCSHSKIDSPSQEGLTHTRYMGGAVGRFTLSSVLYILQSIYRWTPSPRSRGLDPESTDSSTTCSRNGGGGIGNYKEKMVVIALNYSAVFLLTPIVSLAKIVCPLHTLKPSRGGRGGGINPLPS